MSYEAFLLLLAASLIVCIVALLRWRNKSRKSQDELIAEIRASHKGIRETLSRIKRL